MVSVATAFEAAMGRLLKASDFGEYHPLVATVAEAEEFGRVGRKAT